MGEGSIHSGHRAKDTEGPRVTSHGGVSQDPGRLWVLPGQLEDQAPSPGCLLQPALLLFLFF